MASEEHAEQRESRTGRFRRATALLLFRLQSVSIVGYMGAASFIGIEALALVVGFTTVLPIAIPFVVVILGAAYFLRERLTGWRAGIAARLGRPKADPPELDR